MLSRRSSGDSVSLNSQGVEVHHLSEEGTPDPQSPLNDASVRKKRVALKKKSTNSIQDKAAVDPCKYKTKLCRSWIRDGYCSYENVCCYAHGESDLRTVHQNTQVLSSLGYFSELMLLAIENEGKPTGSTPPSKPQGLKSKKASKEDLRAAQVEASLVHFARTSAAQGKGNLRPTQKLAVPTKKPQTGQALPTQPAPPLPANQPPVMVHAPYSMNGKLFINPLPAFGAVPETRFAYNPYGPLPVIHYPYIPHVPLTAKAAQYAEYGLLPTAEQMPDSPEPDVEPPWKHPPGSIHPGFAGYDVGPLPGNQDLGSRLRAP